MASSLYPAQTNFKTDGQPNRVTFTTSRLLEFFSEKELTMQIGHPRKLWPLALLKELIDNGLDACEGAGITPLIRVVVEPDVLTVEDNGPGPPTAAVTHSIDYAVRVSDKSYYVSPTRGQLGNALKCVWAAPFVATDERGLIEVFTPHADHRIEVTLDRLAQRPDIRHSTTDPAVVKTGTLIRLHWPGVALLAGRSQGLQFLQHPQPDSGLLRF